jgi:endonuclease YncB( thermonuclease family)
MTQPFETYTRKGKVVRVVDADTLDVLFDLGFAVFIVQRIRLARIDAPERFTPEGIKATEFVKNTFELVKDVVVQTAKNPNRQDMDRGRRYIGEVWLDSGENLGDIMLNNGLATIWEPGTSGR